MTEKETPQEVFNRIMKGTPKGMGIKKELTEKDKKAIKEFNSQQLPSDELSIKKELNWRNRKSELYNRFLHCRRKGYDMMWEEIIKLDKEFIMRLKEELKERILEDVYSKDSATGINPVIDKLSGDCDEKPILPKH